MNFKVQGATDCEQQNKSFSSHKEMRVILRVKTFKTAFHVALAGDSSLLQTLDDISLQAMVSHGNSWRHVTFLLPSPSPPRPPRLSWVRDASGKRGSHSSLKRRPASGSPVLPSPTAHPGESAQSHLLIPPQGFCFTSTHLSSKSCQFILRGLLDTPIYEFSNDHSHSQWGTWIEKTFGF